MKYYWKKYLESILHQLELFWLKTECEQSKLNIIHAPSDRWTNVATYRLTMYKLLSLLNEADFLLWCLVCRLFNEKTLWMFDDKIFMFVFNCYEKNHIKPMHGYKMLGDLCVNRLKYQLIHRLKRASNIYIAIGFNISLTWPLIFGHFIRRKQFVVSFSWFYTSNCACSQSHQISNILYDYRVYHHFHAVLICA